MRIDKSISYFITQIHGYHSLRNEGTRLLAALPNACKEAKDISTFKRMVADVSLLVTCLNYILNVQHF